MEGLDPGTGRRVVLHLGMHKTGSTSVQEAFRGYADGRIAYADLGSPNHSRMLSAAFNPRAKPWKFDNADPAERQAAGEAHRRRLDACLAGTSQSLILSGEDLWSFPGIACRSLVGFVTERGPRVEALVYLRSPASYAASAFQQRVQSGLSKLEPGDLVPPYRERATRWERALGARPSYVLFDRSAFHGGDLLIDFAHRLGLDPARIPPRAGRANESLSAEATAVLFVLRGAIGGEDRFGVGRLITGGLVAALRGFGRRRFAIDPDVLAPVLAERRRDLDWMEERLGRPFPPAVADGAVLFGSTEGVAAFAREQEDALRRHLAGHPLGRRLEGEGVAGLLVAFLRRIEAEARRTADA